MKIGIVGLPNVGKSTLFNAITKAKAEMANYPFCTIEPNIGVVTVPDARLPVVADIYQSKKIIPTTIEFVDIAGLVKGASKGEGLGNKFLGNIREVDAIAHVIRCFDDENVVHVSGKIDPIDDMETVNTELFLSDLEMLERRVERTKKLAKHDPIEKENLSTLEKLKVLLEDEQHPQKSDFSKEQWHYVKSLNLITVKPILYVANVSEDDLNQENVYVQQLIEKVGENTDQRVITISAEIEEEISELDPEEKEAFLLELGLEHSGMETVARAAYDLLGLISYLTVGPKECRAWTVKEGTKAPGAAGKIHSDMERGFIRAEVIGYEELIAAGSEQKAKELGIVRIEGKDYVMQDGDVTYFRFNV
ncbi:MAG: redox-regulated ATPase YchF [Eubacteriaceae bacterium]|nr:redox-regulated ATPase YchF [Eubacteriaceae bacterium]